MPSLKIAMISYHTCPLASVEGKETGGMNVYVLELSQQLAKLGHQVDIFTRCQDPSNPYQVDIAPGLRLFHIKAGPASGVSKKELKPFLKDFSQGVVKQIEAEKTAYNVMHTHYYLSGLAGEKINSQLGQAIPTVITFHTLALLKNLVARSELEAEQPERIEAELELVKSSDGIITPSATDQQYLQYLYEADPGKIEVVPPGVSTELFKPADKVAAKKKIGADSDHHIILYVGRIEPLKGIDALIYALKIFKNRHPRLKACLWIVGGDISQPPETWSQELKKLRHLKKVLNLPTSVTFVGQRPQHELPDYYNAAEVVVMPSHYESFGMAALEAMACGVPVITTNVAGISTLIDESDETLISTVNNPLLLASQIERVLSNQPKHRQISAQIRQKIVSLDWSVVAQKVISAYRKFL